MALTGVKTVSRGRKARLGKKLSVCVLVLAIPKELGATDDGVVEVTGQTLVEPGTWGFPWVGARQSLVVPETVLG